MTWERTRKSPIPLLIASIAVSLGLAEAVVRVADVGPSIQVIFEENYQLSANPILEYELRPGSTYGDVSINAAGFRDREYTREKPPGVFRIAAIGDSVSFGLWVPQNAAYPKRLEVLLNHHTASETQFEVLNFGVPGYNITQVVERLRTLVLDYDPDLIVYGYVLNDPQAESLEGTTLRDLQGFEQRKRADQLGRGAMRVLSQSRLVTLCAILIREWTHPAGSYARDADTGTLVSSTDETNVPLQAHGDPGGAAYEAGDTTGQYFRSLHTQPASRRRFIEGIRDLADTARTAGVPAIVAIFPLFISLDHYPLADLHELVSAQAKKSGLRVVDLLPAYLDAVRQSENEKTLDVDFMHPSPYGHRIAAVALARAMSESGP